MKTIYLFLIILVSGVAQIAFAQSPVPFGGFDQWENDSTQLSYDPYLTSNADALLYADTLNVYPVSNGLGGNAVHLETVLSNFGPVNGTMEMGSFHYDYLYGGVGYMDQPDSVYIRTRYEIQAGDSSLVYVSFRGNPTVSFGSAEIYLAGTQSNWVTLGFEIDGYIAKSDSLSIQFFSSGPWSVGTPAVGSWIEVDSIYFSGGATPVPNAGFNPITDKPFYKPVGWYTSNRFAQANMPTGFNVSPDSQTCFQSMPYSLRLETKETRGDTAIGFAFNGQQYNIEGPKGGQPWTWNSPVPNVLTGKYQYETPVVSDTGIVSLTVWKWDGNAKTEETFHLKLESTSSCQDFYLPFTLMFTPDSFRIYLAASDIFNDASMAYYYPGSVLHVDELGFDTDSNLGTGLREDLLASSFDLQLFPNPAKNGTQISWENGTVQPSSILIFDVSGRLKQQVNVPNSYRSGKQIHELSLADFTAGIYFLLIQDESGNPIGRKRLVVR